MGLSPGLVPAGRHSCVRQQEIVPNGPCLYRDSPICIPYRLYCSGRLVEGGLQCGGRSVGNPKWKAGLATGSLSPLIFFLINPPFSRTQNGFLFSSVSVKPHILFHCEVGFGSTDFSLCAFDLGFPLGEHTNQKGTDLCDLTALHLRAANTQGDGPTATTKFLSEVRAIRSEVGARIKHAQELRT
jgi:hypothetical protein